jgi:hypothetical protein
MQSLLGDKNPTLTYVPPSTFLTFSTVSSFTYLASLFHLTTTSRIHTSGVFPATQPKHFISISYLLVVNDFLLSTTGVIDAGSNRFAFKAFCPGNDPLYISGCLALIITRSPLVFSFPSGFSLNALKKPSLFLRS